jgi:cellulose 1,4-beta-cellobiosidase
MSRTSVLGLSIFATAALAQLGGQYTQEVHPLLPTQQCTTHGCKTMNTSIVLDSNYRWLHNNGGYDACNPQNDAVHCPNATACAANCGKCFSVDLHETRPLTLDAVIEGVSDYGSMGISVNGSSVTFKLFTSPTTATSPCVSISSCSSLHEHLLMVLLP